MTDDLRYMRRAIELARLGAGYVAPNPMVGAVVVCDGEIIGEGWHKQYGEAHAEPNAINSVVEASKLSRSTLYVTLEPCSHWGKTPPCADLIISKQISRVVVGCVDPYCEVCGGGIAKMQNAGIEVVVGVMEKECLELNRFFMTLHSKNRPYVILKWAETADGYIDAVREPGMAARWMTGEAAKILVHRWRAEVDSIMVGRKTVENDNPELTVRAWNGKNPLRVTMDRNLCLSSDNAIFNTAAQTLVFTSKEQADHFSKVEVIDYEQDIVPQILKTLCCNKVQSLLVEGGRELLQSFIDSGLWDEACVFTADTTLAQLYADCQLEQAIKAPGLKNCEFDSKNEGIRLRIFKNK